MKSLISLLFVSLLVVGCNQQEEAVDVRGVGVATTETEAPSIPEEAMTDALRYFGGPFERPILYEVDMPDGPTEANRTMTWTVEEGKIRLTARWGKGLSHLPTEVYEANAEGIRLLEQNGPVEPQPLYMPANLEPGQSWQITYTFKHSEGFDVEITNRMRVVGTETVTVPLGEFEALVIEETGTARSGESTGNLTGRTWLVSGVGIVKTDQTYTVDGNAMQMKVVAKSFEGEPR